MTASRRVHGAARLLRGALAAHLAIGSAVMAHSGAGHHSPHGMVILLALLLSVPLCTALCSLRLSRLRLAGAVVLSQAALHGLFTLLPASHGAVPAGLADPHAHGAHGEGRPSASDPHAAHTALESAVVHPGPADQDGTMVASHLFAAAVTYLLLRRGELILVLMAEAVSLRPFLSLLRAPQLVMGRQARLSAVAEPPRPLRLWPGSGPRTLRGPPLVMA